MNDLLAFLKEALIYSGLEDNYIQMIASGLALLFLLVLIGKQILSLFTFLINKRKNRLVARDLNPFYTRKEIDDATKYYVDTKFQNVPPSEDEEPGRSYIAAARQPLIPLFLNKAFKNDSDDNKYYLVLADSGMGKTTFMINLYLAYKFKRKWFWQRGKHDIKLYPLGHPKTLDKIKEIPSEEKQDSILLLDAFDEDNEAVLDYQKRLTELLDLVWEFREVVITCRTQFFPSSKDEPTETGKYKFGPKPDKHHFQKIYVSIFSENDIKKYLKKRFKSFLFFKSSKYLKALKVVLKSPNLMMRPMLLSHVDDLINADVEIKYGFQIYSALIDQWLERESQKAGIQETYGDTYKDLLFVFSKALARDLYIHRKSRNNKLSLKMNEIIDNPKGLQLKDIEGSSIKINKYDQSSRSLLNRNALGEYKFSHKSILEYLLALEVFSNKEFREKFHFDSDLDIAKNFFLEMFISSPLIEVKFGGLGISKREIEEFSLKNHTGSSSRIYKTLSNVLIKETIGIIGLSTSFLSMLLLFSSTLSGKNSFFHLILALEVLLFISLFYRQKNRHDELKELKEKDELKEKSKK